MLENHRRTFLYSLGLFVAMVLVFVAVGRHPPAQAPVTDVPFVGRWDRATDDAMDAIHNAAFSALDRALNVVGGGVVTTPLRSLVALWLALRSCPPAPGGGGGRPRRSCSPS